ncbi:Cysteine-rich secretory protein, allergen V5/Tpx-1-related [Trema orientale]|uniref:Cysteine-rich secretory protein, allergen V5/Tpx-1-related n=1 Tax=Trema orientale TaxID=63057 RepID=A0A2P5FXW3_TREOI|nr:Cysteine-rich secretory protein, allergen V5/Tpx-1-related [Trema orientale]
MSSSPTSFVQAVLLVSLATLLLILSLGSSAEAGGAPLSSEAQEYLQAHNEARAAVGVGPLEWSEALANASGRLVRYQRNRMSCQFANLTNFRYGANQLWAGGGPETPRMAVEKWVEEKQYYSHADNTCAPNHTCGVYTQVVWRKSLQLGCAQATCLKKVQTSITICLYNPPGNYVGESPY